jgi:hypothetical protein
MVFKINLGFKTERERVTKIAKYYNDSYLNEPIN